MIGGFPSGYQSGDLSEYVEFFGDKKGALFVQALDVPVLAQEIMRAENYNGYNMTRSRLNNCVQEPNDIHQDVTDLIITTALRHAELDKPTDVGSGLQQSISQISINVNKFLASKNGVILSVSTMPPNNPLSTVYPFIVTDNNSEKIVLTLADTAIYCAITPGYSLIPNPHFVKNVFDNVITGDIKIQLNALRDIELEVSKVMTNTMIKLTSFIMNELRHEYGAALSPNDLGTYLDNMKQAYLANMLRDELNSKIITTIKLYSKRATNIKYKNLSVATAKSFYDNVYANWKNMSKDAREFYREYVALFARITDTSLYEKSNDVGRNQSFDSAWVRLTESEIDTLFSNPMPPNYNNLRLNLMKASDGQILFGAKLPDVQPNSTVWYTQNNGSVECVTGVPVDFLRKLYNTVYRNNNPAGVVSLICDNKVTYQLNSVNMTIASRPKKDFNHNFGKFLGSYFQNSHVKPMSVAPPRNISIDDYPFLSTVDMVYNKVWTYDAQKNAYYRMEKGRRIYYDDNVRGDVNTCYSTYLTKNKPSECPRVINCIIDANPQTLSRCLSMLKDVDLWDAAEDDIRKVGVDMVLLVLEKFGVRLWWETDANGNRYKEPDSFADWVNEVVNTFAPDVKQAIMSNNKLLSYIKGLLAVCRADPTILNRDIPSVVPNSKNNSPYLNDLNIQRFRFPNGEHVSKDAITSVLLSNMPQSVNNGLYNPLMGLSNVVPFAGLPGEIVPYGMMVGGRPLMTAISPLLPTVNTHGAFIDSKTQQLSVNSSSKILDNLIRNISHGLRDVGLVIHNDDKERIEKAVDNLKKYEQQLSTLTQLLNKFVVLSRLYNVPISTTDIDKLTPIKLDQVRNMEDVSNFVRSHISELTNSMYNNMTIQSHTGNTLLNRIYPRFIEQCSQGTRVADGNNMYSREQASYQ